MNKATLSIANVVKDFTNIQTTRTNVCMIIQELTQKLTALNNIYVDVVNTHPLKEYTFGLDAFHFQRKLIEYEGENIQKLLTIVTNRFYCEYYKLYKIIMDYISNETNLHLSITQKDAVVDSKEFPVYKDLDKNINYDFALTIDIQALIVKYINVLNDFLIIKNKELEVNHTRQVKCGINIEHITHYQSYTNALITERIMLYIHYMETLNKHHTTYITRLYTISKDLMDDVNRAIMANVMDTNVMDTNVMDTNVMDTNVMGTNVMGTNVMGTNVMSTNANTCYESNNNVIV
jgi:hypothetical protein